MSNFRIEKEEPSGSSFSGSKGARTPDLSRVSSGKIIKHRKGAGSMPWLKSLTQNLTQSADNMFSDHVIFLHESSRFLPKRF